MICFNQNVPVYLAQRYYFYKSLNILVQKLKCTYNISLWKIVYLDVGSFGFSVGFIQGTLHYTNRP